jgi:hypothetical protein
MAHGRALQYVGDHSRVIPGVAQQDLLPEVEAELPVDPYTGAPWTFEMLAATGDYAWAPIAKVESAAAEPESKPKVPLGTAPKP